MVLYKPSKHKLCELVPCCVAILVLLCIISAATSIIVGVLIVKPGILALDFKTATCKVARNGASYKAQMPCDCSGIYSDDPHCKSSFPCYHITVKYEPSRTIIKHNESNLYFKHQAIIHETESDFSSPYSQCSFQHCLKDYKKNKVLAEGFRNKLSKAYAFPCFYNPRRLDQVIYTRRYNTTQVLLALILPSAFFLLFLSFLIGVCVLQRRKIKEKNSDNAQQNRTSVPRAYLTRDMPAFQPDGVVENTQPLPDPFASINDILSSGSDDKELSTSVDHAVQGSEISFPREESVELGGVQEESEVVVPQSAQMSTPM